MENTSSPPNEASPPPPEMTELDMESDLPVIRKLSTRSGAKEEFVICYLANLLAHVAASDPEIFDTLLDAIIKEKSASEDTD